MGFKMKSKSRYELVVGVAGPLGAASSQELLAEAEDDVRVQLFHYAQAVDQVGVQLFPCLLEFHCLVGLRDVFRPSWYLFVADVHALLLGLGLLGAVKDLQGRIGDGLGLRAGGSGKVLAFGFEVCLVIVIVGGIVGGVVSERVRGVRGIVRFIHQLLFGNLLQLPVAFH